MDKNNKDLKAIQDEITEELQKRSSPKKEVTRHKSLEEIQAELEAVHGRVEELEFESVEDLEFEQDEELEETDEGLEFEQGEELDETDEYSVPISRMELYHGASGEPTEEETDEDSEMGQDEEPEEEPLSREELKAQLEQERKEEEAEQKLKMQKNILKTTGWLTAIALVFCICMAAIWRVSTGAVDNLSQGEVAMEEAEVYLDEIFVDGYIIRDLTKEQLDNVKGKVNAVPESSDKIKITSKLERIEEQYKNQNEAISIVSGMYKKGEPNVDIDEDYINNLDTIPTEFNQEQMYQLQEKYDYALDKMKESIQLSKDVDEAIKTGEITPEGIKALEDRINKLPKSLKKDGLLRRMDRIEERRQEREAQKAREIEDERRKAREEEERRIAAEEEAERVRKEHEKQKAEEEAKRQAEEAKRQAEEAKRKAEEEAKRQEEESKKPVIDVDVDGLIDSGKDTIEKGKEAINTGKEVIDAISGVLGNGTEQQQ